MCEFIRYCLYCLLMTISASFGNNPDGMNFKNLLIGSITLFVLLFMSLGILWLTAIIVQKVRNSKLKK